jgi:hypothetical protein
MRKKALKKLYPNRRKMILEKRNVDNLSRHIYTDKYGNEIILNLKKAIMLKKPFKKVEFNNEVKRMARGGV